MVTPPTAPALARQDISQARKPRKTAKGYPKVMPTHALVPPHCHGPRRSADRAHDRKRTCETALGKWGPAVRADTLHGDEGEIEDGAD